MYWPEKYQLGFLRQYLDDRDIEFVTEPFLFSIPIDILGVRDGYAFAIELKTKNFKRGLEQAERNRSFVDYSYLSVWESAVTESLLSQVKDTPVGLLAVGENVKCLSTPSRNNPSESAKSCAIQRVISDD